ncbi:hypothetical protein PR048_012602 [Dryococelus australis]|uniref:Uncharacterized protein n=1 Tax=Dryococelus australis TaxID=614101 RepID=A0ABQ9HQ00_9NEOP|nr:hypothetical protein PR048_012602 [Dryococelus australis]
MPKCVKKDALDSSTNATAIYLSDKNFAKALCKIFERTPLKYPWTEGISYLDLVVMSCPVVQHRHLRQTLNILVSNNMVPSLKTDKTDCQFKSHFVKEIMSKLHQKCSRKN